MTVIHSSLVGASSAVIALHSYDSSGASKNSRVVDASGKNKEGEDSGKKAIGSVDKAVEALSTQEQQLVTQLKSADKRIKSHELAHLLAAGGYARGGPSYDYRQGPDGKKYAVAGEVQIDSGKESSPDNTISKMKIVQRAALAPVDPSPQDHRVAAKAGQNIIEASQEIRLEAVAGEDAAPKEDVNAKKDKSSDFAGQKGSTPYSSPPGRFVNLPTLNIFA